MAPDRILITGSPGISYRGDDHSDEALRLRSVGQGVFLTYKGPRLDSTIKTRREIELAFSGQACGFEAASELLALLGFCVLLQIEKKRQTASVPWDGTLIEAALDEVRGLGRFVELEVTAPEAQLDGARKRVNSLAEYLGLHEPERRSYCEMLLAANSGSGR